MNFNIIIFFQLAKDCHGGINFLEKYHVSHQLSSVNRHMCRSEDGLEVKGTEFCLKGENALFLRLKKILSNHAFNHTLTIINGLIAGFSFHFAF